MISISKITHYELELFPDMKFSEIDHKIADKIVDKLGYIIDGATNTLTPKQSIAIVEHIVSNRKEITKLLNVTYDDEFETKRKNILDLLR